MKQNYLSLLLGILLLFPLAGTAQNPADSTAKKEWWKNFRLQGYVQTQFHLTNKEDSVELFSPSAGYFTRFSNNKFTVRRGRIQAFYETELAQASLSFDVNETGFHAKDAWLNLRDPWINAFELKTGLFAIPFGQEIEMSSQDREAPERTRVVQTLFPGIRDLGAALSFQLPEGKALHPLRIDAGVFQGSHGNTETDRTKDFVGRIAVNRPLKSKVFNFNVGASVYAGNVFHQYDIDGNASNYHFVWSQVDTINGGLKGMQPDVNITDLDSILNDTLNPITPGTYSTNLSRLYFNVHTEFELNIPIAGGSKTLGKTLIRSGFFVGQQVSQVGALANPYAYSSESPTGPFTGVTWPKYDSPQPYNPAAIGQVTKPSHTFTRNFLGAYLYFVQQIGNTGHHIIYRYDLYDPNTDISGEEIDVSLRDSAGTVIGSTGLSVADVAFTTFGLGYKYQFNEHLSFTIFAERVINEETKIEPLNSGFINLGDLPHTGFLEDMKDDVLTLRIQYIF